MNNVVSKGLGDHPVIVLIGTVAALIAIFVFLTGYENLPDLFRQTQNSPRLYDDFNNSAFDGEYDPKLWTHAGTGRIEVGQQGSVMTFATTSVRESGNTRLEAVDPWEYDQFRLMEAKLKLDSSRRGQGSFVKIQAVASIEDDYGWWVECQLKNSEDDFTLYFCNIYGGKGWDCSLVGYEYQTRFVKGDYDTWYTARFELNSDTSEIRFFLNDNLIGSHVPKDSERLKETSFFPQIGSWTNEDESFIGYFDDVRIGK